MELVDQIAKFSSLVSIGRQVDIILENREIFQDCSQPFTFRDKCLRTWGCRFSLSL